MLTIAQIANLAREIAAGRSFTYTGNGGRGEFRYTVDVRVDGDSLTLSAACNARITEKQASAELAAVWRVLLDRLDDTTKAGCKTLSTRGHKVWRYGFYNMGVHCTEGFRRGIALRPAASAAE